MSGAHRSVSSGSSGPVVSYDLLSGMTSRSVPGLVILWEARRLAASWPLLLPAGAPPPQAILGALGLLGPMLVWPRRILIPQLLSEIVNPEGLCEALTSRGQRTSSVQTCLVPLSSNSSSASESF